MSSRVRAVPGLKSLLFMSALTSLEGLVYSNPAKPHNKKGSTFRDGDGETFFNKPVLFTAEDRSKSASLLQPTLLRAYAHSGLYAPVFDSLCEIPDDRHGASMSKQMQWWRGSTEKLYLPRLRLAQPPDRICKKWLTCSIFYAFHIFPGQTCIHNTGSNLQK